MKHKIVFVACDTSNIKKIKKIITETNTKNLKLYKIWSSIFILIKVENS